MAKFVFKTMTTNAYANIRPFFDEIAEDCSLLSVSNDGTTLILTVDTDLVISIGEYSTPSSYIGASSVVFNGNSIVSKSSQSTGSNPIYVVGYNDSMFLLWISYANGGSNSPFWVFYEKLGNYKYAMGTMGSAVNLNSLKDINNTNYVRMPSGGASSLGLPSEEGHIIYMGTTSLIYNGSPYTKYAPFDTNVVVYSSNPPTLGILNILTIENKEYLVISPTVLIQIDPEEEE